MTEDYSSFGYEGSGEAEDLLRWALGRYHPGIALACSFQNPVLIHMMVSIRPDARVFAIDTGRLNEETYQCAEDIERVLGVKIEWYFPKHDAVEAMVRGKGHYSFKSDLESRRECCAIRKVEPLNRALSGLDAWITGLRREHNVTRGDAGKIEIDEAHNGIVKINPIADWSSEDVREYVKKHNLPYNSLLDMGYASIGCAPCTRAIAEGEHPRAGRWWWESAEHKECGLHVRNWNI